MKVRTLGRRTFTCVYEDNRGLYFGYNTIDNSSAKNECYIGSLGFTELTIGLVYTLASTVLVLVVLRQLTTCKLLISVSALQADMTVKVLGLCLTCIATSGVLTWLVFTIQLQEWVLLV